MTLVFRGMAVGDLEAVAALEAESFTAPWNAETFGTLLDRPGAEMLVLAEDDSVVGYAVLWCIMDQGEIANIAIQPNRRGQHLGTRLLDETLAVARERGVKDLFLEVRESNAAARHMYQTRGFREIGRRKSYYDRPKEDALVLKYNFDSTPNTETPHP